MNGRRVFGGAVAAIAILLLAGRVGASLYTEHLWYLSLGAEAVWRAKLASIVTLTAVSFTIVALFAFANLYAVRQSVVTLVLPRRIGGIEIGEEVPGRYLLLTALALSLVLAAFLTFPSDRWHEALLASVGKPFGWSDPYFGADLGFFVYWLPFESDAYEWSIEVVVTVTVLVIALYALTPSLRWERGTLFISAYVRRHFMMFGALLLLVLSWSYRLSMYRLLAVGSGAGGAFTFADHKIILPATLLLSIVTLCAALVVAWAAVNGQSRLAFAAVSAVLLLSLVARVLSPLVARRSADPVARITREGWYLATRLGYTRNAFGVDRMRAESLGTGFTSVVDASPRLAVWDGATLARAAQRVRRVHVVGDGAAWQATPSGIAAWLVEHGNEGGPDAREVWGIGRFDPSSADDRGLPLRESVGTLAADEMIVGEPAVYDSAPDYAVLSDSAHQLAGVEMVSTRSRLMHAWSLQNFRLLFGELPANRPVIVQRRAVRDRVGAIVPFLLQGSEVVPVVASDTLYWAVELYATSADYPLAQRIVALGEERGYFQHAATALVHAASGRVRIVLATHPDPVAQSWQAYFPKLFTTQASLTPALRAALPPLTDAARIQALAFAAAGFRGDSLEVRHFAAPDGADSAAAREPTHAVIPGLHGITSLWTLLDSSERVRGVVAATGGASRVTTWIPVISDGNRWGAVVDRLRSADTIQRERGSVRAVMRVVPVGGHALYVQPTFQWRPGATPTLVRVAAFTGDSVRLGATLAAAFDTPARSRPSELRPPPPPDLRLHADSLYRAMKDALARGDWVAFGRAFDALGVALRVTGP